MKTIFLDHNSTTPILPEVLEAMLPYNRDLFFNPSGIHPSCRELQSVIEESRETILKSINMNGSGRLIFTASASESNNIAIRFLRTCNIITSPIEHPSVLNTVFGIAGGKMSILKIDNYGNVCLDSLKETLSLYRNRTPVLVSIQHANQVLHTIQDLKSIASICSTSGAFLHVDATQTLGKIKFPLLDDEVDFITISSHKCYGPKGIGALWISERAFRNKSNPFIFGGGQEYDIRSGTYNVAAIAGFSTAVRFIVNNLESINSKVEKLTNVLRRNLESNIENISLNGDSAHRLNGGIHYTINGVDIRSLIISTPEVIVSTGMSCSADKVDPIFRALKRESESRYSLRMQIGFENTLEEIERASEILVMKIKKARNIWGYL